MDQSLKQRLIGVTIVVALVVIFVPMLFEKSEDREKFSSTGIPSIPDDVMEKNIELPKTAEDVAPKEEEEKKAEDHGYKIVPMNEEPSPKPKLAEESNAKPAPGQEGDVIEDKPVSIEELQSKSEADKPTGKAKREVHANPSKVPAKSPASQASEPMVKHLAPVKPSQGGKSGKTMATKAQRHGNEHQDDVDARDEPVPSAATKADKKPPKTKPGYAPKQRNGEETGQGNGAEPKPMATKKTSTVKPPEPRKPKSKPKDNKANTYDAQPDADMDLDGEPIPVPAKPVSAPAKPKPVVTTKPKSTGTSVTKPVEAAKAPKATPKSSEASHPAKKAEKPDAPSADTNATPAKPKAVKPVSTPAAKPAPPVKPTPATVKPTKSAEPEKQPVKPQTVAPDR